MKIRNTERNLKRMLQNGQEGEESCKFVERGEGGESSPAYITQFEESCRSVCAYCNRMDE